MRGEEEEKGLKVIYFIFLLFSLSPSFFPIFTHPPWGGEGGGSGTGETRDWMGDH